MISMSNLIKFNRMIPGREEIYLEVELDIKQNIVKANLSGVGSLNYLKKIAEVRKSLVGSVQDIKLPKLDSEDPGELLLGAALLFIKGKWNPPYKETMICHCRGVKTSEVEQSIIVGSRLATDIMRTTSASTACGTCQPDVEALIQYWSQSQSQSQS